MRFLSRLLAGLALLLPALASAATPRPPNIVLILADDQGYPDLGIIGSKPILTPHLDRLAREGVRGTSFYMTWPRAPPRAPASSPAATRSATDSTIWSATTS